mmetsp:Transcript_6173/g.15718  ORF Transcript_6173/g.15718 Transcript_6173/m.15718 type:complete len:266 (-) Transcript_6173:123-920(-)
MPVVVFRPQHRDVALLAAALQLLPELLRVANARTPSNQLVHAQGVLCSKGTGNSSSPIITEQDPSLHATRIKELKQDIDRSAVLSVVLRFTAALPLAEAVAWHRGRQVAAASSEQGLKHELPHGGADILPVVVVEHHDDWRVGRPREIAQTVDASHACLYGRLSIDKVDGLPSQSLIQILLRVHLLLLLLDFGRAILDMRRTSSKPQRPRCLFHRVGGWAHTSDQRCASVATERIPQHLRQRRVAVGNVSPWSAIVLDKGACDIA